MAGTQHNGKRTGKGMAHLALLLAVFYLLGNVEWESLHAAFHSASEEQELHTVANEANACHQRVYHNGIGKSCDHKTHVVKLKKCPGCHLGFQSFHLPVSIHHPEFFVNQGNFSDAADTFWRETNFALSPSRAPPAS